MPSERISRREFIGVSAGAAAGLMLAARIPVSSAAPMSLTPYRVPMPIPPKAAQDADGVIRLKAEQSIQAMHQRLPAVTVWGYNQDALPGNTEKRKTAGYLGPTIELHKNSSTTVEFTNNLQEPHPRIPIDTSLPGIDTRGTGPRILTHLHGGFVTGTNDGNPHATHDEYGKDETQTVTYPAHPRATTLWYHDHALGMTRLNVYAGLAGFLRMRDDFDTGRVDNSIGIPGGSYEVPILIQDKTFRNGQLFYSPTTTWIPEFFGNTPVINGAVQPFLTVEPRKYRLTFLNGSQSRFYNLELAIGANQGPTFHQIGSEGGMFDAPVATNRILLLPAERADVIVDFSGFEGQNLELKNRALPKGVVSPATPRIPSLMQFRVSRSVTTPGPETIPSTLAGGSMPSLGAPVSTRYITLEEVLDAAGNPVRLEINGRMFEDAVDETPAAGTIEDWSFVNISADTHPIHMHLTNFQVMGRAPLDGLGYAAALAAARKGQGPYPLLPNNTIAPQGKDKDGNPYSFLLGPEVAPGDNERGWKDTVGANPNQVTRIRQRFDMPGSVSTPEDLRYVYHCHILEHEDNDMMRPFNVIPAT
jgi:spore coat protein A, manganese oxidase